MFQSDFGVTLITMQAEFVEMPGLKLTLKQAARLFTLPVEVCHAAVAALVASGFLVQSIDGAYMRRGTPPVRIEHTDALTWTAIPVASEMTERPGA